MLVIISIFDQILHRKSLSWHRIRSFEAGYEETLHRIVEENNDKKADPILVEKLEKSAQRNWDLFYRSNTTNFFKDRHYLSKEFPLDKLFKEMDASSKRTKMRFMEAGCGVGNAMFPLANVYGQSIEIYAFDFSKRAVEMVRKHKDFKPESMKAEVVDLVHDPIPEAFPKEMDFISLIFVLSAITPCYHEAVLRKLFEVMGNQSFIYFRDYARYDMAQIRFALSETPKLLGPNFYVKHDGTRCYYFELEEVVALFEKVGFVKRSANYEKRIVENRKEKKEMRRIWVQATFQKIQK